ncbi:LPD23 domain-containing protein [uncultured Dialister sp.]|uniref:LPD23 domain-containing protein n=1 Tax=Dialister succinatiphilus TaxID=487173 RepID=UPI0034A05230
MPHAAAAMVSCLQKAESMERGGLSHEEIWKETGWMRGRTTSGDSKSRGARANQFLQRRETT